MPSAEDVERVNPSHLTKNEFLVNLAISFNVTSIPLALFLLVLVCITCVLFLALVIHCVLGSLRRKYVSKSKRRPFKAVYADEIPGLDPEHEPGSLGYLNYSIEYSMDSQLLNVGVLQAFGLSKEFDGDQLNPYVRVTVYKSLGDKKIAIGAAQQTDHRLIERPIWNQLFSYTVREKELRLVTVHFEVFDYVQASQDIGLGQLSVSLGQLDESEYIEKVLERSDRLQPSERRIEGLGEVCIGLCYLPSPQAQIELTVFEARGLDLSGLISEIKHNRLFFQVELRSSDTKQLDSKSTRVQANLVNPYFNEKLRFGLLGAPINECKIVCRLRRRGRTRIAQTLGYVTLGVTAPLTTGQKHWEEMTRSPKRNHVKWHVIVPKVT